MNWIELHEVPGVTSFDAYPVTEYRRWEEEVARPALEAAGWKVGPFYTSEGDSFGPLIRSVVCRRGAEEQGFFYG